MLPHVGNMSEMPFSRTSKQTFKGTSHIDYNCNKPSMYFIGVCGFKI